jgi:hypothetical protein
MYPEQKSVPTGRQQSGDKAEKEINTVISGTRHGDDNSIRVNDLIFVY